MCTSNSRRVALALAGAALGVVLAFLLRPHAGSGTPASAPVPASAPAPAAPPVSPAVPELASEPASASASESAPASAAAPLLAGEAAEEAISDLAVTYDAASVPALARYLAHPDPEIRAAARDGLVQLGERAAIPFLESAAKSADDLAESQALREAAEFLALPTWTEQRRARQETNNAAPAQP